MQIPRFIFAAIALSAFAAAQTEVARLIATDSASGDQFGQTLATEEGLSVIGAPDHMISQNIQQGAAYVYRKSSSGWKNAIQTETLTASDGAAYDVFGSSVAMDGETIVVGAPTRALTSDHGAVYVFVRSDSGYKQVAKLTASDGFAGDGLGTSVTIRDNTIMAGMVGASENGFNSAGATYVFVEPSTGWGNDTETAKLTASDPQVGAFAGSSVSLDGTTVVVGAYGASFTGKAYIYVKPTNGWTNSTETAQLHPSNGVVNGFFGYSISLRDDTILVGSPGAGFNGPGAGYIFVRPASGWTDATENAELTAPDAIALDALGTSVFLIGQTAFLGAPNTFYSSIPGRAYVYARPATGWTSTSQFSEELRSIGRKPTDQFGTAVSVDQVLGVGDFYFVGAMTAHFDAGNPGPGMTYVFQP